jgi:hypothetical protein
MRRYLVLATALIAIMQAVAAPAAAQLQNSPFTFRNSPGGGVGMSIGGRQAILNDKLLGDTPSVILRDATGQILTLQEGPNNTAIVAVPGGNFIPGYRGSDFRRGNAGMGVGVFNAYFLPRRDRVGGAYAVQADSADLVNTWTLRVLADGGAGYGTGGPVDMWTAMVFGLSSLR